MSRSTSVDDKSSSECLPGVLIVEDDATLRSFLRSALEARARVFEASDGERALEILRDRARRDLRLVLIDYKLPGKSGLAVLLETKQRWPWIPIILLTAFGSEELAVQAFRSGASDYLTKPVQLDELLASVSRLATGSTATAHRLHGSKTLMSAPDPRISKALAFLDEHFAEPMSLTRLAAEMGLGRFHFCRLFRRDTGQRLRDYLLDLRVRRAKILLENDQIPVTQVANAVGFTRLSHFDKTLRRVVGQSPTEYRRWHRSE
jgi:YesN/AraC family two-component response regulator